MSRRTRSWNGYETELTVAVDAVATTFIVVSTANITADTWLSIDPDKPASYETVKVTNVVSPTEFTVERGGDGSAGGSGNAHGIGAKLRATPHAQTLDDTFSDIEDLEAADAALDTAKVNVAGDTMTGPLVLPGNPTAALEAAPKQYVDALAPVAPSPIGQIIMWPTAAPPAGFLLCDGAQYDGTDPDYVALFGVLGLTYGGSGSDFDVPDFRQRFPLGKAVSGTGAALGDVGGAIDHKHTNPDVDSAGDHTHDPGTLNTDSESAHTHTNPTTSQAPAHAHGISGSTGDVVSGGSTGPSHNAAGTGHLHSDGTLTANVGGLHSHTQGASGSAGLHDHGMNGATASEGAHQHTQDDTGIENPPFLAINFAIRYA